MHPILSETHNIWQKLKLSLIIGLKIIYNKNMSQDEPVDIVDENENFLEIVTKGLAHEKGLLHKTVISQIINSKGEWLLVKQSSARQDAGQYVSPVGGHVTSGETNDEALKRESMEEVGFTDDFKYELVGKKIFDRH